MQTLGMAISVWSAVVVTLTLPPWMLAWRLTPAKSAWRTGLTAFALGGASQALFGLFWDRLVRGYPMGEIALYYGFWAVASIIALRFSKPREVAIPLGRGESWLLGLTLLAALVIRSLHPLGHAALGQSDAYSHLQFIRQVVTEGMIHNQIYPPGYSWIMALPVATFQIDPYWMARFGGAVWGVGLVLALFGLGRFAGRQWTGLIMAALVAFCPLWMPLLKTGVGAFANQAGLFFLPLILLAYMQSGRRNAFWLFLMLSMSLVSTVPMMWISLMPVLLMDRLLAGIMRESRWWKKSGWVALALLPAFTLLVWQSSRIREDHLKATMTIVTGEAPVMHKTEATGSVLTRSEPLNATGLLVQNYLSVKRRGYGNRLLNGAGIALGIVFALALAMGMRKRNSSLRLLGIWGLITSLQAATGFMQFSGYQREGWSLLMATAWLGGMLGGGMLLRDGRSGWRKKGMLLLFGLFLIWTCRFFPRHPPSFSTAEDELIDVARHFAHRVEHDTGELPLTLVMRQFTAFHGNQGDLLDAVVGPSARVHTQAVGEDAFRNLAMDRQRQYLFMMDRIPLTADWSPGLFAQVQPHQVEQYLREQHRLFQLNQMVKKRLEGLPPDQWSREIIWNGPRLEAVWVRPVPEGA